MNQPGTDIVLRLRWASVHGDQVEAAEVMEAAAKEIEAQRKLLNITKAALDHAEAEVKTLERIIRDDKRQGF